MAKRIFKGFSDKNLFDQKLICKISWMSLATRLLVVISFLCYKYENVNGSLDKYADILLLSTTMSSDSNKYFFCLNKYSFVCQQIFLCLPTNISLLTNKYFFVYQQIFLCLPKNISSVINQVTACIILC